MTGTEDDGNSKDSNRRGGKRCGRNKNIVYQKQQSTWLGTAYMRVASSARTTEPTGTATTGTVTIGMATMAKVSNTTINMLSSRKGDRH